MTRSRWFWLISAVCSVVVSLFIWDEQSPYFPKLYLLPLVYVLSSSPVILGVRAHLKLTMTERVFCALLFARLTIIPLTMHLAGSDFYAGVSSVSPDDMLRGTHFLCYEAIFTTVVFLVLRSRLLKRRGVEGEVRRHIPALPGSYIPYILLLLVGLGALPLPQVRERFSFFTTAIEGTAREIVASYSPAYDAVAALTNLARYAAPIVLIAWSIRMYRRKPSPFVLIVACCGIVFVNMFYVSTSRASFFIPLVASVVALRVAIPTGKRLLTRIIGGALVLTTVVVTLRKSLSGQTDASMSWFANYLSIYLMGPQEYAVGLRAVDTYGGSVAGSTLRSDLLGNVPVLSSLADLTNRTSQFFNWSYVGSSAFEGGAFIIPASIQGVFYLGYALGPVFACLGLAIALLGERHLLHGSLTASSLYLASFAVVTGVLYSTNSVSTLIALVSFPLIPLMLLGWWDNHLGRAARTHTIRARLEPQGNHS